MYIRLKIINSVMIIVSYQRHKKFQTLQRIQSIPTLSPVLFIAALTNLATVLNILCKANLAVK